jgi:hypothetical protein
MHISSHNFSRGIHKYRIFWPHIDEKLCMRIDPEMARKNWIRDCDVATCSFVVVTIYKITKLSQCGS